MLSRGSERGKRHALGQHFLTSNDVAQKMVDSLEIKEGEAIFEIGTGRGILTKKLASSIAKSVVSYEIDSRILLAAKESLSNLRKVRLELEDAFSNSKKARFDAIISSLPYSRSLDFVEWIAQRAGTFRCAVVLAQKEFVDKIVAKPGFWNYRAVSVISQLCFSIERIEIVSQLAFDPPPRVLSCICRFSQTGKPGREGFFQLNTIEISMIKRIFTFRGRLLRAALKKINLEVKDADFLTPKLLSTRVEKLEPYQFLKLARLLEK